MYNGIYTYCIGFYINTLLTNKINWFVTIIYTCRKSAFPTCDHGAAIANDSLNSILL